MNNVTRILESIQYGDAKAADELLPLVYGELRKLAAAKMSHESPNQTLQPTALVHEAWLRLVSEGNPKFDGRAHFFAAAAEAMRRILIDKARRKRAALPQPSSRPQLPANPARVVTSPAALISRMVLL